MDTKISLVEAGAVSKAGELFIEAFGHRSVLLVGDGNTMRAAGLLTIRSLEQAGLAVRQLVFDAHPRPYANEHAIRKVRMSLALDDSIAVALGSGTLNDVTKRASFELKRPYMVVATAPSMDGYTSFGAAINFEGFKQTMACSAPVVVLGDTNILKEAPKAMIASGFADCMAKFTAGMDWILADLVGVHPIRPDVWDMVQIPLRRAYSQAQQIAHGDGRAIASLFESLAASGYAMQVMEDSRPASGAEHLVSHCWEMEHLALDGEEVSHGFKVAVGTMAMVLLYEDLLRLDESECYGQGQQSWPEREADIRSHFTDERIVLQTLAIAKEKFVEGESLVERRRLLAGVLPKLKERIGEQLPPFDELRSALSLVGAPTTPMEIGSDLDGLKRAVRGAQMIRNRYTILDLYYELGLYDRALNVLEGLV
jgi:glycerol-1-phosphate dehydrogenase [NAD(P)+]